MYIITFLKRESWLANSRVSISYGKHGRFTPLYVIAYDIVNSMQNLCFDKEDYFHVLVLYTGYVIKEIENISPCVPIRYRNTRGNLGELEIEKLENSPYGLVFPLQFLVLPNSHSRFYNCMETQKIFSISKFCLNFQILLNSLTFSRVCIMLYKHGRPFSYW